MALVQSYGGIIYVWKDWKPNFLVLKRQALSKKIEWTAPKGKAQEWEDPIQTAKREIFEETKLDPEKLINKGYLWDFLISFPDTNFEKKVSYYLFEYKWSTSDVQVADAEGYIWVYNWLPIESILNLIPYKGLRELYRKAYNKISE